jgi:hypothetical protein
MVPLKVVILMVKNGILCFQTPPWGKKSRFCDWGCLAQPGKRQDFIAARFS